MVTSDFQRLQGELAALRAEVRRIKTTDLRAQVAAIPIFPTGALLPIGTSTPPTGFIRCDGAAVSRTTYSDLFAVIGTTFGIGDGSTTFNVPDMRSRFAVGIEGVEAYGLGDTGGAATVTLTASEMPSHTHTGPSHDHTIAHTHSIDPPSTTSGNQSVSHSHTGTTGNQSVSHTHSGTTLTFPTGQTTASTGHTHEGTGTDTFARSINQASPSVGTGKIAGNTGNQSASHNHTITTGNQSASHSHSINIASFPSGASSAANSGLDGTGATGSAGSGTAHENRPPYLAVDWMIKT